ncbi:MAG: sugar ABC transporter substrate-binding protein [Chloroflexota bacterium]|nr:sugar ABC transporter substrate-binding protein [Chloroflexota bacterium]
MSDRDSSRTHKGSTRRSVFAALAGSGSGAFALAACGAPAKESAPSAGGRAATEAPAKLAWWSRGTQEWNEMMMAVGNAYMQAYPKISLDYAFQPSAGYTDRIITAAASDTLPDVFHLNSQDTISLASKGIVADVSSLLAKDGKVKKSDFFPWAFLRAEKDGKTYAMPLKGTANVLYVNQSLFEREGLPLPKAGWTWADYVQTARKITKDPATPSGTWGGWSYDWRAAVWQNGGDLVDKAGKKALIAEAPAVEAIQWMADLAHKERVHPKPDEGAEIRTLSVPFSSGRIGMFAGGEPDFGNILKITDFKWSAAPLPVAGPGKQQASFGASTLFGLSPKTKAQAQAWGFLSWMTTQRQPQEIINKAAKLGVPPHKGIYEALFVSQPPREDVKKVIGEMANANRPYLEALTTVPQIEKIFGDELKGVWAGTTTARDATQRIAEQITPLLNK